ncbi:MAG: 3-hydroxyacyl-CoA dehydrogenase [Arenicella sp.]|nr:3-hydroxyacyl-CoA dehydrogenase [Arenicella sp.]
MMAALTTSDKIAVIGAGTMGAGIAQVAANAGHAVILLDIADGAAQKGADGIRLGLGRLVEKGKKTQAEVDDLLLKITPTDRLSDIKGSRLIVEAIVENLAVKQRVIADIEAIADKDTIIASNTSSISISALAATASRPENIIGMHFFNPAAILKLVEVVSGLQTNLSVAQIVFDTAAAWGKKPVHAKSTPGFIVNRVARPFYAEALRSLTEQLASVETIDTLMRSCGGFKMGPLELTDLIGQDINSAVTESVYNAFYQDKRFMPSVLQAEMVAAGLLGRKSGQGFYRYPHEEKGALDDASLPVVKSKTVSVLGSFNGAIGLNNCLEEHGYQVSPSSSSDSGLDVARIEVGSATIKISDGRTATQRSAEDGIDNLVLLDYARDYHLTPDIALSCGVTSSDQAQQEASDFFRSLGKRIHWVKDTPGMQVLRTVCMLVNEAHDAVNQGVCSFDAVDTAMQAGVAYPAGPIAWGDSIGLSRVVMVLNNIQRAYGEERYRVSPLLLNRSYESSA